MDFSSMLFVFFFLTLNLLSQFIIKEPSEKNKAMLIFSLIFCMWAGPAYLLLLLLMTFLGWVGGALINTYPNRSKLILWVFLIIILGIFGFFAYRGNVMGAFGLLETTSGGVREIVVPLGISIYTLKIISYLVDIYRHEIIPQKKFWMLLLYTSLFHHMMAGPIVRYRDIHNDILRRESTKSGISAGISRFTVGLVKKVVLADGCAAIVETMLTYDKTQLKGTPVLGLILGIIALSVQVYLNLSAYSDMAIGMGLMCGLHYKENFDYPYAASSVTDFWKRWNISLMTFFNDYVFKPLGGGEKGANRQIINLLIVWTLIGLWHGGGMHFVVWGLLIGGLIYVENFLLGVKFQRWNVILRHIWTIGLIMITWLFFRFGDFTMIGRVVIGLFGLNGNGFTNNAVAIQFKNNIVLLVISVIAVTPLVALIKRWFQENYEKNALLFWIYSVWDVIHPVVFIIIAAMELAGRP